MRARGRIVSVLAGVAVVVGATAVLYARQSPVGTVMPGKFLIINKAPFESVPVTLTAMDPKLPALSVAITTAPEMELGDRTLQRLAPPASQRHVWEYSMIAPADGSVESVARLNASGRDGWELVSVLDSTKGNSFLMKRMVR